MFLALSMNVPTIIVICVVSVVVLAGIIIGAVLLHKHRFSSASQNLRRQYEEVHFRLVNNCDTSLKRLETLGKHTDYYQGIFQDRKKQYDEILKGKDSAISTFLDSLDDLVKKKDYRKVREIESEISNDICAFNKSVSDFASDLSTLLQEDDVTNSSSVPVKSKYRQVEEFYQSHKNELKGLEPSFETILSSSKKDIEDFQVLTNEAKYDEAKKKLNDLDQVLTATISIMDQLPLLEASIATVLPGKIDDLLKTYREMKEENYVIDFLNVEKKTESMRTRIAKQNEKLQFLEVDGVRETIDEIQAEITDLNAAFQEEKNAKINYNNTRNAMDDSTYADERNYSSLMNSLPQYQKVYQLNRKYVDQMYALKTDIETIGILKRQLDSYLDTSSRQPYTVIMKKSSEMRSEMTKCERTMKDYREYITSLKQSAEEVYQGLRSCVVEILKVRNDIRHLGLKDFLANSDFRINRFLSEIKEINDMLQILPLDVTKIVERYSSLHDDCQNFLSDTRKRLEDASKAEQAIVYANAYRVDFTDCDKLVKEAEKAYEEADFSRAYAKACRANDSFNQALHTGNEA